MGDYILVRPTKESETLTDLMLTKTITYHSKRSGSVEAATKLNFVNEPRC